MATYVILSRFSLKHFEIPRSSHLLPAFGNLQIPDVSREVIQTFLVAKLQRLSWETVHHLGCALAKILASAEEWSTLRRIRYGKPSYPGVSTNSESPYCPRSNFVY